MGYHELDELGEKIQDIIDSAINEKNYQKLNQTINQTVNKAIDNGSEALRDALNNTFGGNSGKYTNYRTHNHKNKQITVQIITWLKQCPYRCNTGYQDVCKYNKVPGSKTYIHREFKSQCNCGYQ